MKIILTFLIGTLLLNTELLSQVQKQNLVIDGTIKSGTKIIPEFLYYTVKDKPFTTTNKIPIGAKLTFHFDLSKTMYAAGDVPVLLFSVDFNAKPDDAVGRVSRINIAEIKKYLKLNNQSVINIKNDFYFFEQNEGLLAPEKEVSSDLLSLTGRYEIKSNDTIAQLDLQATGFSIRYFSKLGSNYSQVEEGDWSYKDGKLRLVSKLLRNEAFGTFLSDYKRIYELTQVQNSCIPTFKSREGTVRRLYVSDFKPITDTIKVKLSLKSIDYKNGRISGYLENNSGYAVGSLSCILTLKDKKTKAVYETIKVYPQSILFDGNQQNTNSSGQNLYTRCSTGLTIINWKDRFSDIIENELGDNYLIEVAVVNYCFFK